MVFDKVFKGKVVLEEEVLENAYIGVKKGKVEGISKEVLAGELIDLTGEIIFPGAIDVHVHSFSNPEEGFLRTSELAARGGVTTFLEMPYDHPNPINNTEILKEKIKDLSENSYVDIGLWGTVSKHNSTSELQKLIDEGVMSFKLSTFEADEDRFPRIPNDEIIEVMKALAKTNVLVAFHSEDEEIVKGLTKQFEENNRTYSLAHAETRPPYTESAPVLMLMEFAKWTNVKLHIVHVSHPRTLELIRLFKKMGVDVSAETCYTYLLLDEHDLKEHGPYAKMNPPLRSKEDVELMWKYLEEGVINLLSSDHVMWSLKEKEKGQDNIFKSPAGLPGLEVMIPLMFDAMINKKKFSLTTFAQLTATNAANRFSIKSKGKIAIGYDADFLIINPNKEWEIIQENLITNIDALPFKGRKVKGKVTKTVIRGETVFDEEKIVVKKGYGCFIEGSEKK